MICNGGFIVVTMKSDDKRTKKKKVKKKTKRGEMKVSDGVIKEMLKRSEQDRASSNVNAGNDNVI